MNFTFKVVLNEQDVLSAIGTYVRTYYPELRDKSLDIEVKVGKKYSAIVKELEKKQ